MKRSGRVTALLMLLTAMMIVVSLPVFAQEEDQGEPGDGTTTTIAEGSTTVAESTGISPAVPVESPDEPEATPDWTYRYMIPTGLVLAVVVVLLTSIRYFTNVVRKRYRIIEE